MNNRPRDGKIIAAKITLDYYVSQPMNLFYCNYCQDFKVSRRKYTLRRILGITSSPFEWIGARIIADTQWISNKDGTKFTILHCYICYIVAASNSRNFLFQMEHFVFFHSVLCTWNCFSTHISIVSVGIARYVFTEYICNFYYFETCQVDFAICSSDS